MDPGAALFCELPLLLKTHDITVRLFRFGFWFHKSEGACTICWPTSVNTKTTLPQSPTRYVITGI